MVRAIRVRGIPFESRDVIRRKPMAMRKKSAGKLPTAALFNQGGTPTIALVNAAKTPLGLDINTMRDALQVQVDRDFVPHWGLPCKLIVVTGTQIPANCWAIVFLDNADQAGALGYHDLTPSGLPMSKVFVQTIKQYGESVSVTASHELLEMLADPGIQMGAFGPNGLWYAYENADAVETYAYKINNILVSDFVFPSWFESFRPAGSVQFDFLKKCNRPFQLLPGGYIGVFGRRGWTQIFGSKNQAAARKLFQKKLVIHDRSRMRSKFAHGKNPHRHSSKRHACKAI